MNTRRIFVFYSQRRTVVFEEDGSNMHGREGVSPRMMSNTSDRRSVVRSLLVFGRDLEVQHTASLH